MNQGFELSDFSYRIVGEVQISFAPHDSFTSLSVGAYTIEELVPDGFVKGDWRMAGGDSVSMVTRTLLRSRSRTTTYAIRTLSCLADKSVPA